MHTIRNALAALLLLPCILLAAPAHEWRADLATREVANLYPRHGETAAIRCTLTRAGAPYVPETVSASVSTNGVWGDGWPAPATFASNVVVVSWSPEIDPGAETLCLRIHVDGIHRPSAMLHLGPGGGGSTLPPPGTAIDFAETRYVNEPWATRTELRDATNALVIAAVDLAPYATWQGLDSATDALRQSLDARLDAIDAALTSLVGRVARETALTPAFGTAEDSEWICAGAPDGVTVSVSFFDTADEGMVEWNIAVSPAPYHLLYYPTETLPDVTRLDFVIVNIDTDRLYPVTATRVPLGYTLGSQTNAPLAAASHTHAAADLAEADPSLAAIRAAAASIALPPDPTAAEIGAALTNLISIIAGPQP